ncbi:MAG: hypothetical protein ACLTY2_01580 [Coprococcus eutactus]|jgi:hypothetical protein
MRHEGIFLQLLNAKERNNVEDFLKTYILICSQLGVESCNEVIELLNEDMNMEEKQNIMTKELFRIQELINKMKK